MTDAGGRPGLIKPGTDARGVQAREPWRGTASHQPALTGLARLTVVDVTSLGFQTDLIIRGAGGQPGQRPSATTWSPCARPANPDLLVGQLPAAAGAGPRTRPGPRPLARQPFRGRVPRAPRTSTLGVGTGDAASQVPDADALRRGSAWRLNRAIRADRATAPAAAAPELRTRTCRPLETGDDDWQAGGRACGPPSRTRGLRAARPAGRSSRARLRGPAARRPEAGHGWPGSARSPDGAAGRPARHSHPRTGQGLARYQDVGHAPRLRAARAWPGTLVWQAGQHALAHGARTLVMAADPAEGAIRVYRSVGFAQRETQLSLQRAPS